MKKAQATLEFTVIFVIMVTLLMGLLGLWKWSSDNIVSRQLHYNATRLAAGSGSPGQGSGFNASQVTAGVASTIITPEIITPAIVTPVTTPVSSLVSVEDQIAELAAGRPEVTPVSVEELVEDISAGTEVTPPATDSSTTPAASTAAGQTSIAAQIAEIDQNIVTLDNALTTSQSRLDVLNETEALSGLSAEEQIEHDQLTQSIQETSSSRADLIETRANLVAQQLAQEESETP